ncbi:unnamed protein product [Caenorhabditis angaria]|uniref:DUF148 domain-containing protein n=1 Tax=Caenorhabditis angaria TaxID=860376 RepID=A0A9P1IR60_9PELO|nr:unnamed protein product [Caenorhabditis angaria]
MNHQIFLLLILVIFLEVNSKATKSSESSESSESSVSSEENADNLELEGFKIGDYNETYNIVHDQNLTKTRKLEIINSTIYSQFDNETAREEAMAKFDKAIELDGFAQEYVESDEKIKNITDSIQALVSTETFKKMNEDDQKAELDKITANLTDDDLERIEEFENSMQNRAFELGLEDAPAQNETLGLHTFGAQGI